MTVGTMAMGPLLVTPSRGSCILRLGAGDTARGGGDGRSAIGDNKQARNSNNEGNLNFVRRVLNRITYILCEGGMRCATLCRHSVSMVQLHV